MLLMYIHVTRMSLDVWLPMFIHDFELQQCKSSFSSHLQVFGKLQPDGNRRLICVNTDEHQEDAEHFSVNGWEVSTASVVLQQGCMKRFIVHIPQI